MISVEVENRSGAKVDDGGAVELAGRVLRAEGIEEGELGIAFVGPDEMRALKRDHLGIDEATDVLSFPIDGRDEVPGRRAARARRRRALPAGRGRGVALAAHARPAAPARLRPRRRDGSARAGAASSMNGAPLTDDHRLVQQRVRGDHPRAPHAAEHADPFRGRVRRPDRRAGRQRDEARADRPPDLDHVRADRGDAEHRDRGGDRHRDDVVRPDGEAREGHRRGRGPDRDA